MSTVIQTNLISTEEYLQGELATEVKHELIDGYAYAMAGAHANHERISGNVYAEIRQHLKSLPCEPFGSDMKVKVGLNFFYPDVSVDCGFDESKPYYTETPVIIVEVLSRSTRKTDQTIKRRAYLNLPSLQEYVLVEQDFVDIEKRSKVDVGDVIFGMIGTIGNPVVIYDLSVPFAIKNVALFKFSGDFDRARWVQYYLDSDEFKLHIERSQTGNAQRFVGLGFLRNTIIPAPPIEEITKIASILSSMDSHIEEKQRKLEQTQSLKKSLMQDLLTGKVRVTVN